MLDNVDVLKAFQDIMETTEVGLREQMNLTNDWTMRDVPWMKADLYSELLSIIGPENCKLISGAKRGDKVRATLFINKQGRENIKAYAETIRT